MNIFLFLLLVGPCFVDPSAIVHAAMTATGDVSPTDPASWTSSTVGFIGNQSNGSLLINGDSDLLSQTVYLGGSSGVTGEVMIDGSGSTWTNSLYLFIGANGTGIGKISITNGGSVTFNSSSIGSTQNSKGIISVDGAGSVWTNSNYNEIGENGSGTLAISNGGSVNSVNSYVGYNAGSQGLVTVDGRNSKWKNNVNLTVGARGSGTVIITNGGTVTNDTGSIGNNSGSTGLVTVEGSGSTWNNSSDLEIGDAGNGTLNISGGGVVTVGGRTYVARNAGSSGQINFGPGGGTLTTNSLMASPSQLSGTGTINTNGLVADIDLTFDSSHNVSQSFPINTVTLKLAPNAGSFSYLGAGYASTGSLTIRDGQKVFAQYGYVGRRSGSTGVATVAGSGSAWTTSSDFYLGEYGSGTLNISGGGTVTVGGKMSVGRYDGSSGQINFGPGGGTLTTNSLMVSPSQLSGTGTINTNGLVSDIDLVFDSTHALSQTFLVNGVTVNLSPSSSSFSYLGVGLLGTGSLTIRDGKKVTTQFSDIAITSGSTGVVTVEGVGSTWNISSGFQLGTFGSGTLNIRSGGKVNFGYGAIGSAPGSQGTVLIDGIGSTLTCGNSLTIGNQSSGILRIRGGGTATANNGYLTIGNFSGSTGSVWIDGIGSTLTAASGITVGSVTHGSMLITGGGTVSSASGGVVSSTSSSMGIVQVDGVGSKWGLASSLSIRSTGTLIISDGGTVTAGSVSINTGGLVAIDVGTNSALTVGNGTGTLSNSGTMRIVAGAMPAGNTTYKPVSAATWSGSGSVQALGGTWNPSSHVFTVSNVQSGSSNVPITIDRRSLQRVSIGVDYSPQMLGASFARTTSSSPLTFTGTVLNGGPKDALLSALGTGQQLLSGWTISSSSGYTLGDPIYLSLKLGSDCTYSRNDLQFWSYDGTQWSPFTANDLACNGNFASFTTTSMGTYAVSVPEPSTFAILILAAFGLMAFQRRRAR